MIRHLRLPVVTLIVLAAACTTLVPTRREPTRDEAPVDLGSGPTVVEFGPTRDLETTSPNLKVRFDRDMVMAWPLGMQPAGPVFEITPPVEGQARWASNDLVSMAVHGRLPLATTFDVTFALPDAMGGPSRAKPLHWTFSTPRPSCALLERPLPGTMLRGREALLVECSAPLERTGLGDWITVSVDDQIQETETTLLSDENDPSSPLADWARRLKGLRGESVIVIRPRAEWPWAREIEVRLSRHLRVVEGPLTMGKTTWLTAQEIPRFAVESFRCDQYQRALTVRFTTPVELDQLQGAALSPLPLEHFFKPVWWGEARTFGLGSGARDTTYRVTLPAGVHDVYGQVLPATEVTTACGSRPMLAVPQGSGVFRASAPKIVELRSTDLDSAQARAIALSSRQLWAHLPTLAFRNHWSDSPLHGEIEELSEEAAKALADARKVEREVRLPPDDGMVSTPIDLNQFLAPHDRALWLEVQSGSTRTQALYQTSDLGFAVWSSQGPGLLEAVRLSDGVPAAGVEVQSAAPDGSAISLGRTDQRGLLRLQSSSIGRLLMARTVDEQSIAALVTAGQQDDDDDDDDDEPASTGLAPDEELLGRLRTERNLYGAGDRVNFVGWAAIASRTGVRSLPTGTQAKVHINLGDKVVAESTLTFSQHGKIWGSLELPVTALPYAHSFGAEVTLPNHTGTIALPGDGLRVAAFNPSEVALDLALDQRHILAGDTLTGRLQGVHRSGGAAHLSRVETTLGCGVGGPADGESSMWRPQPPMQEVDIKIEDGSLAQGKFRFQVATPAGHKRPQYCTLALQVYDRAGRVETATASVRIHPSRFYLQADVVRAEPHKPVHMTVQSTGWLDEPVAVSDVRLALRRATDKDLVGERTVNTRATKQPTLVAWPELPSGRYFVEVTSNDGQVRTNLDFTVDDEDAKNVPDPTLVISAPEQVEAGQPFWVAVQGPATVRAGVLVLIRNGVREIRNLQFTDGKARARMSTKEAWYPGVRLEAEALHSTGKAAPRMLHSAKDVSITSATRVLKVTLAAPEKAHPGDAVDVVTTVRDGRGQIPRAARLSLWAVDEGVLAVTGYDACEGLEPLAVPESAGTDFANTLEHIIEPYLPAERRAGLGPDVIPGCASVRGVSETPQPRARFATTPLFAGDVPLDEQGRAHVGLTLPHNLTAFRITALATAPLPGERAPVALGTAQRRIESSLPLLIRPVVVSRLRPGDEMEATALVHNLSERDGNVEFAVEALGDSSVFQVVKDETQQVFLHAHEERMAGIRVRAGQAGQARIRWRACLHDSDGNDHQDTVEQPIIVRADEPVPQVTAVTGRVPAGQSMPVRLPVPTAVRPDLTRISVRLSGSLLGEVEEALHSLIAYPHGCVEQTMSRLVPLIVAPTTAERLAGRPRAQQASSIIERLNEFALEQHMGVGFWPKAPGDLFATAWTTLVLAEARRSGLVVEAQLVNARTGLWRLLTEDKRPQSDDVAALVLFALASAGEKLPSEWETRLANPQSTWAQAMMALAFASIDAKDPRIAPLLATVSLGLDETTTTARVRATPLDSLPSNSPAVTQAAVLWAFARLHPDHSLIEKLTTSLLDLRPTSTWANTFETAMALLALSARDGLRDAPVATKASLQIDDDTVLPWTAVAPASVERTWPMPAHAIQRSTVGLTVLAAPEGDVSYTAQLAYVPLDYEAAAHAGMAVVTTFRSRFGVQGLSEPLLMGEIIAIDVGLWSEHDQEHVAVEIPLAAGLEPFDPTLAKRNRLLAPNLAPLRQLDVAAQEYHADRIRIFLRHLPAGPFRAATVYVRAAVPGTYLMPAARAEAMYAPNISGRNAARRISITAPPEENP